jgi:putative spermidine/putrescine transport system permease protein
VSAKRTAGAARVPRLPVGLLALPLLLFLAICYFWPVGVMLGTSIADPQPGFDNFRQMARSGLYLRVFLNTFGLAATVTAATLVVAYPVAWYLTIAGERQRRWLIFLILVPSWTSILVRSYGWLVLLGRQGVVNGLLTGMGLAAHPLPLMFNTTVVALAMVQILLPFLVLPLYTTMGRIDPALVLAASGLGAGRLQAFLRIHLPLSLPGIVAGASIVFVLSLGFFITPALLGSPRDLTVAMLILQQFTALLNWGFGAALATVLLAVTLAVLFGFERIRRFGGQAA